MNTQLHPRVAIIGGGLAGCECAHALAKAGLPCTLFEMRPKKNTPAHLTGHLAELVCSNSLRSDEEGSAVGLLKLEMEALSSLVMEAARATRVPAGKALAVDRALFARFITQRIQAEPLITLKHEEVPGLDHESLAGFEKVVVAAGPLASDSLSRSLSRLMGREHLYFYDAIAPIVEAESVNMDKAFMASRYQDPAVDPGDYLNCPFTEDEYRAFVDALLAAEKVATKDFEKELHFEGCMPVEALAERGPMTLAFGPLKPVGLVDPRRDDKPFAVLQLRAENREKTRYNLVGCQTKLTYKEQARVFRLIPGLEKAEFERFGSMHRNTFVNAPQVLNQDLSLKDRPHIHLAGQITGVEGYVESAACGLWLGYILAARLAGQDTPAPPPESALGALLNHLRTPAKNFQPSNVVFGLMPPLNVKARKRERKVLHAKRARKAFSEWLEKMAARG